MFDLVGRMAPPVERESSPGKLYQEHRAHVYACEMEATRHAALRARASHRDHVAHGDAFRLKLGADAAVATELYLNPPYDHDRQHGRLEERWLRRFAPVLRAGGALFFVVPFYALAASAVTLATVFCDLACYRFPGAFFGAFKQVVLVGRKRAPLLVPDPEVVAQVNAWAANEASIPELPEAGPAMLFVEGSPHRAPMPHDAWTVQELDERALREAHVPWHQTDRGGRLGPIANAMPAESFWELLSPRFPVATVPRPAHLAAGLASGVLSGARLRPTTAGSPLPEILVRGTFNRRFVTVDEKLNKDHEKVGEIQVQVPELQIVALDLRKGTFHTLTPSVEKTGARTVATMTAGDLLASYGRELLATLRDRCPALYDPSRPGDVFELPEIPGARSLFVAQAHAVRATTRLLGEGDRTAILLGEIGTGKTTVSVRAALANGARRVIVVVPPHVAPGFAKQVPTIWPSARAVHLKTIADVDAFMADRDERPIVAMLTRSDAKLGHAWAGVAGGRCPRCGAPVGATPEELAKGRVRCGGQRWEPTGPAGFLALRLAEAVHLAAPNSATAQAYLPGRVAKKMRAAQTPKRAEAAWTTARPRLAALVPEVLALVGTHPRAIKALLLLLWAIGDDALTAATARTLYVGSSFDPRAYGEGSEIRSVARALLLTAGAAGAAVAAEVRGWPLDRDRYYSSSDAWKSFTEAAEKLAKGEKVYAADGWTVEGRQITPRDGRAVTIGDVQAAREALAALSQIGHQRQTEACGEPLFQAVPEPRKFPLAHYIARRYRRHVRAGGFALVVDEAHEDAAEASAQALASQQLLGLRIPTVVMTGSVMNGYAESLFNLLWWTSAAFRAEFDRKDRTPFVHAYGYVKRIVEERDSEGQRVVFGSHTDRVERVARETGHAPGVLPTLLLRHLLPRAVTLQMSDIESELPDARDIPVPVRAEGELLAGYKVLERKVVDQMKRDRFSEEGLAGKLFGQLAELPGALDRMTADISGEAYEVRYPASAGPAAGRLVASVATLPADVTTPKERAMLDVLGAELAEGRNVVVFAWHLDVIPRLARLLGALGKVAVLDAGKVPPRKRDAWIESQIAKKVRILVLNPVCVATGINSMVPYFSTDWWHENPACNPQILRQAKGRTRRIGQALEKRSCFPFYEETAQAVAYKLLLHKAGIGEAADGLDATAALQAAGVGTADALVARDLGRALFDALTQGERESRLAA